MSSCCGSGDGLCHFFCYCDLTVVWKKVGQSYCSQVNFKQTWQRFVNIEDPLW